MRRFTLFFAVAAIVAGVPCEAKNAPPSPHRRVVASASAATRDWSRVTAATAAGGFVMGNPNANVKLIEYGSMTCPHCGEFDRVGVKPLIDNYVKSGQVSWEFRNFIRDPFDLTAALVARCNGARSFFGVTRGLYASQKGWIAKLRGVPQKQLEALSNLPQQQQFQAIAKLAGFQQFAAAQGIPVARSTACLANNGEVTRLVKMTSDAESQFHVPGTPSFVLNGALVDQAASWEALEPKLKAAVRD